MASGGSRPGASSSRPRSTLLHIRQPDLPHRRQRAAGLSAGPRSSRQASSTRLPGTLAGGRPLAAGPEAPRHHAHGYADPINCGACSKAHPEGSTTSPRCRRRRQAAPSAAGARSQAQDTALGQARPRPRLRHDRDGRVGRTPLVPADSRGPDSASAPVALTMRVQVRGPVTKVLPHGESRGGHTCAGRPRSSSCYWQHPGDDEKRPSMPSRWYNTGDFGHVTRRLPLRSRRLRGSPSSAAARTSTRSRSRTASSRHPGLFEVAVVGVPHPRWARRSSTWSRRSPGRSAKPTSRSGAP